MRKWKPNAKQRAAIREAKEARAAAESQAKGVWSL